MPIDNKLPIVLAIISSYSKLRPEKRYLCPISINNPKKILMAKAKYILLFFDVLVLNARIQSQVNMPYITKWPSLSIPKKSTTIIFFMVEPEIADSTTMTAVQIHASVK